MHCILALHTSVVPTHISNLNNQFVFNISLHCASVEFHLQKPEIKSQTRLIKYVSKYNISGKLEKKSTVFQHFPETVIEEFIFSLNQISSIYYFP